MAVLEVHRGCGVRVEVGESCLKQDVVGTGNGATFDTHASESASLRLLVKA